MTSPPPSLRITSLPAPSEELLKTDTLGRVQTSLARRAAILDEFERSGGSGAQFAALLGIKYPTFASWIQQRRRERADASPTPPGPKRKKPAPLHHGKPPKKA